MKITRLLRSDCPSGIDCDRVYDTDSDVIAVQGRVPALGVPQPPGKATVLIARHLLDGIGLAPEALADAGPDLAVTGSLIADPAAHGISTPPSHEALVLVHRTPQPTATA
jgi:hypothetical protein